MLEVYGEQKTFRTGYISGRTTAGYLFQGQEITYAVVDGLAIFEGDIVLGTAEQLAASSPPPDEVAQRGIIITGNQYRWTNGVVPYTIDSNLTNQQRVTDAIAHWQQRTPIRFVLRTNQADYVTFRPGSGASSNVGRIGGQQFITLGTDATTGNAIHEIGHTVGIWHEQSREDRNSYVQILSQNIQPGTEHNFNQQIANGTDLGPYDYGSIMHYPSLAFSTNNQPTIIPLGGQPIGQRDGLSEGDIAQVNFMYGTAPNMGGWTSLGGAILGLAVGRNKDGRLEIFGIGTDNTLRHIWQTAPNNGWSGWASFGGEVQEIAVANNLDGRLEVFARWSDGTLRHIWQTGPNNGWSGWASLGGAVREFTVGRNKDGRLEVFARWSDNTLRHIWQTAPNNGWSNWGNLGGSVCKVAVANNLDGRLEVFARWTDDSLRHIWQTAPNNGWSNWGNIGGQFQDLCMTRNQDGRLEIFAIGNNDALYHIWQTSPNNGWSGLGGLNGVVEELGVGSNADGRIELFVRGTDNQLWHRWQVAPNNGWSG